ncbi:MAG: hypothetical protein ACRER0_00405 [Gammaproteobacteria bacterium]
MRRIALFLLIPMSLAACSVQQQPIRTVETVLPAAGVSVLDVTANIGKVSITPSSDVKVHVSVSLLSSSSFFGLFTNTDSVNAARGASLNHTLDKGTLKLGMQYPADSDDSGVNEHWTIALPAGVHVSSHLSIGEIDVKGISGGVDANLNVGKVLLDVPGGPLKITANVGKIQATVHSLNYSDVTLSANVGKTALTVDGVSVGDHQKAGAGDTLSFKGGGKDTINLQVNTGKVDVALLTH